MTDTQRRAIDARDRMRKCDAAYTRELRRRYGPQANKARWDGRGEATARLRRRAFRYLMAAEEFRIATNAELMERPFLELALA